MGSAASSCCTERACFNDGRGDKKDPVAQNAPEFKGKARDINVGKAAVVPANVTGVSESDCVTQDAREKDQLEDEFDTCEEPIEHLTLESIVIPTMTVRFQSDNGSTQMVKFTERPIGLNFGPAAHWGRVVKKVAPGSHAEETGVRKGWVILTINGESLINADDETIHAKFGEAVSALSVSPSARMSAAKFEDGNSPMASTRSPASSICGSPTSCK